MELLYKNIIIFVAIIIGSVLLFFGIRDLSLKKNKKVGLFLLTILSVLVFSTCSNSQEVSYNNTSIVEQSNRIIKLNKTLEWQHFKAFWHELDDEVPTTEIFIVDDKVNKYQSYGSTFNNKNDDSEALIKKLNSHLKKLSKTKLLTDTELLALEIICKQRIEHLYKFNSMLISHFAPPIINTNLNISLELLENKIDTLIQLEKFEIINTEEYEKSLENINNEIKNILITSTILSNYQTKMYEGNSLDENTLENNQKYFENHFSKLIEKEGENGEGQKKYTEIKEEVATVKESFETIDELINDLLANKNSRIIAFEKTDAYKDFKELWFKIDTLKLNNNSNNLDYKAYEKNAKLYTEHEEIIKKIQNTNLFSKIEIDLLYIITNTRLKLLIGQNPITRSMMPPLFNQQSVVSFEEKIDVLLDLKSKEIIDQEEYEKSLIEIFNLTDRILISSLYYFGYIIGEFQAKKENFIENYLQTVEVNYLKLISENPNKEEEFTANYKNTIKRITEIRTALPTIHKLIESFEK